MLGLYSSAPANMADGDYHIYKVPRPTRSHSFTTHCSTPPLPIRVPAPRTGCTVYTQNQVYAIQPPLVPNSAPPALPPRNRGTNSPSVPRGSGSAFSLTCAVQTPMSSGSNSSGTASKRWWADSPKTLPRFGSFKEKSARPVVAVRGLLGQAKRRFSEDAVASSANMLVTDGLRESDNLHSQLLPGKSLTLGRLTEKHAHSFPFQVKALQSYSFQASQLVIANSDQYNLFFVKQQQFVSMSDSLGSSYTIPLNSAVQFGYINPSDRKSTPHTLAYKSYSKVADLLALSALEMPQVVCAQRSHKGQNRKCSLEENEILLILQIRKSKLSGRKYLKVYSFTTKLKKNLYHDCVGHFTTNPAHLRLWLTDMAIVSASIFPCKAVIYLEKRFTSALKSFPSTLLQADSFVTLTELKIQSSIVASLITSQSGQKSSSQATLLDIPVTGLLSNLQVEVQTPLNSEVLQAEARRVYEGLDITSLQSLDDAITDRAYNTKCLFYTILRKGSEQVGLNLLIPSAAYQNRVPEQLASTDETKTPDDLDQDSDSDNEHYEKLSDWVGAEQHSLAPAFPITGTQLVDTQPVSSSSPTLSSDFLSLYTRERDSATPTHSAHLQDSASFFSKDSSPANIATTAGENYEVMESPAHWPEHLHNNIPSMHENSFDLDVSDLPRAVRLLEDRVVPLEKKVAEHQQLQALVRSLSARIAKLETQLMPHPSHSATHSNFASVQATNISQ